MTSLAMRLVLLFSWGVLGGVLPWVSRLAAQTPETITQPRCPPWEESEKLTRALTRTIEYPGVEDKTADLESVLGRLAQQYGLSFTFDETAFKAAGIDDVLKTKIAGTIPIPAIKTTVSTVVKRIVSRISGSSPAIYVVGSDTIEITTMAARLHELGLPEDTEYARLVKKRFRKKELGSALEEIGRGAVLIDIRVEPKTRTKVSASLWYVPEATALELLADMAGLAVVSRNGVFYVTSPTNADQMKKEFAARPAVEAVGDPLFFRSGFGGESSRAGITLRQALEATGKEAGVNLLIDPRVERKLRGRVTHRLDFAPTETVLELLADMAGLAVVKRSNVYYVTSPDNAARIRKENVKPPVMESAR